MFGLGTLINTGAVIAGGLLGLFAGKLFNEKLQKIVTTAMGLAVTCMSLAGIIGGMLVQNADGTYGTRGTYMLLFSLVLGGIIGQIIDIDQGLERFGTWLKEKTHSQGEGSFVDGFLDASCTICIGGMAVMGSIMDGINGDYSILLTKSVMDFVILVALSAAKGKGCIFSAIPIFILQGGMTLLARLIAPLLTDLAVADLSLCGSVLILCVGLNLLCDGKFRIKVANLLPAIVLAVAAAFIPFLN